MLFLLICYSIYTLYILDWFRMDLFKTQNFYYHWTIFHTLFCVPEAHFYHISGAHFQPFLVSTLLRDCSLCWDRWNGMWRLHLTWPCILALGRVLIWVECPIRVWWSKARGRGWCWWESLSPIQWRVCQRRQTYIVSQGWRPLLGCDEFSALHLYITLTLTPNPL